jgi:hypothetical protein
MNLHNGGDNSVWFILAMADWQLGEKAQARTGYNKAVAWMEKNEPQDAELCRFRAEAAGVLGITDPAPPEAKEVPSGKKE